MKTSKNTKAPLTPESRVICWFSCGATSAVACKLALNKYGERCVVGYTNTGSEHDDNKRFIKDCEQWFGADILALRHHKYGTVDEVIVGERYLNGVNGAKCTQLLKRAVREKFQRPGDLHVFGFDSGEIDRAAMFRERNQDIHLEYPLIQQRLFKADCLAILKGLGIELPEMYRLGYRNNNCIGCVKGGMGYWNKIRKDFPDVFKRRAEQERLLGHSCIKGVFLDELQEGRGRYSSEPETECDDLCNDYVNQLSEEAVKCI